MRKSTAAQNAQLGISHLPSGTRSTGRLHGKAAISIPSHLVPTPITASLSWTCKKSSAKALADSETETSSITTNSHHHRSSSPPAGKASVHRVPRMSRTTGRFQVEARRSRQQSTVPLPKIIMPGSPAFGATNTSLHCAHCAARGLQPRHRRPEKISADVLLIDNVCKVSGEHAICSGADVASRTQNPLV